jgi:hypothetical protein
MTRQLVVGGHVIRQLIGLVGLQNCLVSGCEFERTYFGRTAVAEYDCRGVEWHGCTLLGCCSIRCFAYAWKGK